MNVFVFTSLALALIFAVVALVHQVRLRRALEKLLRLILNHWRPHENEHRETDHRDLPDHPGDRLRR